MLTSPAFFVTYALILTVVFLLLTRFLDLYEREPLSILALMFVWGAVGATSLSMIGNGILGSLRRGVNSGGRASGGRRDL